MKYLAAPSVVNGHVDFFHVALGLKRLEQVVYTVVVRCENIGQMIIHAVIHVETNRIGSMGNIMIEITRSQSKTSCNKGQISNGITALCLVAVGIVQRINKVEILV